MVCVDSYGIEVKGRVIRYILTCHVSSKQLKKITSDYRGLIFVQGILVHNLDNKQTSRIGDTST